MIQFNSKLEFGSKAQTLERLESLLPAGTIPRSHYFEVKDWTSTPDRVVKNVQAMFPDGTVIVRSSSNVEDGEHSANAGAFLSVPDIDPANSTELTRAIDDVVESYTGSTSGGQLLSDHVLVQEMISSVQMSGVVFTQDMSTGAPYYVINYDDETGNTDSVTGGSYNNRTLYVLRSACDILSSERFASLLGMVREIENQVDNECIDVEFAIEANGAVRIFQVRRITTQPNWNRGIALQINDGIGRAREFIEMRYGGSGNSANAPITTVLGNMPDWNPAEMIGTAPRPLALSLYRHLITDRTWRIARAEMGYQHRPGRPLMVSLLGQPFIDTRESFYSFLPAGLEEEVQDHIVNAWLNHLREDHHLHDKVEFEVATTAFTFDFDHRAKELLSGTLSDVEYANYRTLLRELTRRHVTCEMGAIADQINRLGLLQQRRKNALDKAGEPSLELVSELLEDAIHLGTLPFAILARHGFIAVNFLRSMVAREIISPEELDQFQGSISTVATEFLSDMASLGDDPDNVKWFSEKYGHLRPGTYDILSMRYDSREALKTFSGFEASKRKLAERFAFSETTLDRIDRELSAENLGFDAKHLIGYIKQAITGREYAKFAFTQNLSDSLEVLAAWGERFGLSRDELSFVDYRTLMDEMAGTVGRSVESSLREASERGRTHYRVSVGAKLPFLITKISDLYIVPLEVDQPNFITRTNASASTVEVSGNTLDPSIVDGKIVLIESADPGYDWIFSRTIQGLITRYGGANSHMAIRCAEFKLPAAIGCGEQIFERARASRSVELLCAEGVINFL